LDLQLSRIQADTAKAVFGAGFNPGNSQIRTIRVPVVPSTRAQSRIEAQP
jgi:hypothetical protein